MSPLTLNPKLRLREDVWLFCGSSQPKELPPRWITQLTRSGVVCPGFPPPRAAPGVPPLAAAGAAPLPPNPPRPAPGGIMGGESPSIHSADLRISAALDRKSTRLNSSHLG